MGAHAVFPHVLAFANGEFCSVLPYECPPPPLPYKHQHVHGCLLRQPPSASAKEQPSSAAAASSSTHPNAARTNGSNDNRSREVFSPTRGVLLSDRQRSARRGGRKQFVEPPPEGPRTARVSLQGVFSHPTVRMTRGVSYIEHV